MGRIEKYTDSWGKMTVFTVYDAVAIEEYYAAIREYYMQGPVTKNVLWDLTEGILDHLSSEDIVNLGRSPKYISEERSGGKTAIVAPSDLAFGLARMFEYTAEPLDVAIEMKVFRTREEAMQWLRTEED